jgi:integrase
MAAVAAIRRTDGVKVDKRKGRASQKTAAYYLRDCKSFCRWLAQDGRAADNALAYLTISKGTENRRQRRALASDELALLIAHAEGSGAVLGLSGVDRAMFYRVLAGTGFRVSEAGSLTPASFDLDADPPTVTVEAGYSKRRRQDVQPIRADLAGLLRPWLKTKRAGAPVFDLPDRPYAMGQRDLAAAKAVWVKAGATPEEQAERQRSDFLEYLDSAGRYADLHSLRHTYVSTLANANVPIKVVQELARHSDPRLTLGVYTHARIHDLAGALQTLPGVKPADAPQQQAAAATGTDNATAQPADRQQDRQQFRQQSACETTPGDATRRARICETSENRDSEETGPIPANVRFPAKGCDDLQQHATSEPDPGTSDTMSAAFAFSQILRQPPTHPFVQVHHVVRLGDAVALARIERQVAWCAGRLQVPVVLE